jgi:DNA-binding NtrC family response regulator
LPPLRERQSDLPLLVAHFVKEQNKRFETQVKGFSREAIEAMMDYDWPGNIRQLSNVVQAAMAIDSSDYIGLEVVAQLIDLPEKQPLADHAANESDYATALARFESDYLNRLLSSTGGNIEEVAHQSGMNVATVYRKIKKYGLR